MISPFATQSFSCRLSNRLIAIVLFLGIATIGPVTAFAQPAAQYEQARRKLVDETIVNAGVTDSRVLDSLRTTPRHEFVAPKDRPNAYFDMALPIGDRQT